MDKKFMYSFSFILGLFIFSNCASKKTEISESTTRRNDTMKINTTKNSEKKLFGKTDEVSLEFLKPESTYFNVIVSAPKTDSADCYCPAWYSTPLTGLHFIGIITDEPGQCEGNVTLNGQLCGFTIYSGDTLSKYEKEDYYNETFKDLQEPFKSNKYYLAGARVSIPDSNGNVGSYMGEFPIYAIDSSYALLDITLSLDKECSLGELKNKNELFKKNGLSIRVAIDATKPFPEAKQVK